MAEAVVHHQPREPIGRWSVALAWPWLMAAPASAQDSVHRQCPHTWTLVTVTVLSGGRDMHRRVPWPCSHSQRSERGSWKVLAVAGVGAWGGPRDPTLRGGPSSAPWSGRGTPVCKRSRPRLGTNDSVWALSRPQGCGHVGSVCTGGFSVQDRQHFRHPAFPSTSCDGT